MEEPPKDLSKWQKFKKRVVTHFKEDHLWFSVFLRDVDSNFTSMERVTVLACIVYGTMACNAMFFGTNGALGMLVAAVLSSYLILPVSWGFVMLFERSGLKAKLETRELLMSTVNKHVDEETGGISGYGGGAAAVAAKNKNTSATTSMEEETDSLPAVTSTRTGDSGSSSLSPRGTRPIRIGDSAAMDKPTLAQTYSSSRPTPITTVGGIEMVAPNSPSVISNPASPAPLLKNNNYGDDNDSAAINVSKDEEGGTSSMYKQEGENTDKEEKNKKTCFLPVWGKKVAWSLCLIWCLGMVFMCILYGLKFDIESEGDTTESLTRTAMPISGVWVVACMYSSFLDIFINEPIGIIAQTLVSTFITSNASSFICNLF